MIFHINVTAEALLLIEEYDMVWKQTQSANKACFQTIVLFLKNLLWSMAYWLM